MLGFGVFFSIVTSILVFVRARPLAPSDQRHALESLSVSSDPCHSSDPQLEGKFGHVKMTSEHFNTAGRDVKTGLTASLSLDHSLNPNPGPTLPLPLLRLNPS